MSRQTTVGICAPPSADHPKLKTHALEISSARAVSGTRSMRYRRIGVIPARVPPVPLMFHWHMKKESVPVLWASLILGRK